MTMAATLASVGERFDVPQITADYRRSYGVHDFRLASGRVATALSFPDWDWYHEVLDGSIAAGGDLFISPETITTANCDDSIDKLARVAEVRLGDVVTISEHYPDATIALGTYRHTPAGVTNNLEILRCGQTIQSIEKRVLTPDEMTSTLIGKRAFRPALVHPEQQFVICRELADVLASAFRIHHGSDVKKGDTGLVLKGTKTLIASTCWSVPMPYHEAMGGVDDDYYRTQLEKFVAVIMGAYPHLAEVLVVDRNPSPQGVPLNVHFQRQAVS